MKTPPPDAAAARVAASYSGYYILKYDDGSQTVARLKKSAFMRRDPLSLPVTGDMVLAVPNEAGEARILSILPRKSLLARRDPSGSGRRAQALAANFDVAFVFAGCDRPLVPGRLERLVALARSGGAGATVVFSKCELAAPGFLEDAAAMLDSIAPGVDCVLLSSRRGDGVEALRALIGAGTAIFLGESGAGKSTFLNVLCGCEVAATGEVREKDAKGRHTTTSREFIPLPGGGAVIDTPGLREAGLWESAEGISATFPDVERHLGKCRFSDCRHTTEPGCAIRAAIESGELDPARWEAYSRYISESSARGRERRGGMHKARR